MLNICLHTSIKICSVALLFIQISFIADSASLYATENHKVLVNASDSLNRTLVHFKVLAEPRSSSLEPIDPSVTCKVNNVTFDKSGQKIHQHENDENKPSDWFSINKTDNLKNILDENIFSLSSEVDLAEALELDGLESLDLSINCSTGDGKLQGSFPIQIFMQGSEHETEEERLLCSEPKVFHVSENVGRISLGKVCCDFKEERYVSSLSTDSDEYSNTVDVSVSNSSSEEYFQRGLDCFLRAQDAETKKDHSAHFDVTYGILSLTQPLDFEEVKEIDFTFSCIRESSSASMDGLPMDDRATQEVVETVRSCRSRLKVRNVDDKGPWIVKNRNQTLKYLEIQSYFPGEEIKQGQLLHRCLSFNDADATDPKSYEAQVIGDAYNIYTAVLNHEYNVGNLRCVDLLARRDFDIKHVTSGATTFSVKIIDPLFVPPIGTNDTNSVEYKIKMSVRGAPTINVTHESAELSHLVAPYHRVSKMRYRTIQGTFFTLRMENCVVVPAAELPLLHSKPVLARRISSDKNKTKHDMSRGNDCRLLNDLFRVSPAEGIVYIGNVNLIDTISTASLNLLLERTYKRPGEKSFLRLASIITVNILNDSHPTFRSKGSLPRNVSCSWSDSQQSCLRSNGVGTSRGRCTWIVPQSRLNFSDVGGGNETEDKIQDGIKGKVRSLFSHYETCSSAPSTCPDRVCDELENSIRSLCPQDCTPYEVHGIGNLMSAPNSGIGTVHGTKCWCDRNDHCSCDIANRVKRPRPADTTTACIGPRCRLDQTAAPHESEICGNICRLAIVSSVAVVFFLLSGILMIIFLLYRKGKFSFKNFLKVGNDRTTANGKTSKVARISGTLVDNPQYADTEEPLLDGSGNSNVLWNKIYFSSNFKFSKWEIGRSSLMLESVIGEGEFGKVLRARAKNVPGYPKEMVVAVKTLKDCASASEHRDLISEFNLLQQVEHPNIVKLIGICSSPEGPLYVVVEYCKHGSLKSYLKKFRINWQHQDKCLVNIPLLDAHNALVSVKDVEVKSINCQDGQKEIGNNTSSCNGDSRKNERQNCGNGDGAPKECPVSKRNPALMSDCTMNAIKYTTHPYSRSDKTKFINETLNIATSCPTLQSQTGLWYRRLSDEKLDHSRSSERITPGLTDARNEQELVQLSNDELEDEERDENKHSKSAEELLEFIGERDLLSFCWQIAKGMEYLGAMRIVHRDLAARNILVAEGRIAKISDFGLSRDVYEGDAYLKTSKGPLPVKWMAPESLFDHIFTSKSDVWSYGVVMWEIVTMSANPYPGISAENLFALLKSGYRMEKPVSCSAEIFEVMLSCWQNDPKKRPPFKSLVKQFEKFLSKKSNYLDLSTMIKDNDMIPLSN